MRVEASKKFTNPPKPVSVIAGYPRRELRPKTQVFKLLFLVSFYVFFLISN